MASVQFIAQVQSMYVAYYGRPGDPGGVAYWANQLEKSGGSLEKILPAFGNSAEYTARFSGLSNTQIIEKFYQNIYNRSADQAGLDWFKSQLDQGKMTLVDIAKSLWDGAQGTDIQTRDHKLHIAKLFTEKVAETGGSYTSTDIPKVVDMLQKVGFTDDSVNQGADKVAHWFDNAVPAAEPTALEQYNLELLNAERANPAGTAASYGIDLNEGLAPGTLTAEARQPLAMNLQLLAAARKHVQWMLDNNVFSHTGEGGSTPWQRVVAEGYHYQAVGENIAYQGTTATITEEMRIKYVAEQERALFMDKGIPDRGHRTNLLEKDFKEVGIAVIEGKFNGYNAQMIGQDFATKNNSDNFLVGVVYRDKDHDKFYTPGEGLADIDIQVKNNTTGQLYSLDTYNSGGYQIALPNGQYTVTFTVDGQQTHQQLELMGSNVKIDLVL